MHRARTVSGWCSFGKARVRGGGDELVVFVFGRRGCREAGARAGRDATEGPAVAQL